MNLEQGNFQDRAEVETRMEDVLTPHLFPAIFPSAMGWRTVEHLANSIDFFKELAKPWFSPGAGSTRVPTTSHPK